MGLFLLEMVIRDEDGVFMLLIEGSMLVIFVVVGRN